MELSDCDCETTGETVEPVQVPLRRIEPLKLKIVVPMQAWFGGIGLTACIVFTIAVAWTNLGNKVATLDSRMQSSDASREKLADSIASLARSVARLEAKIEKN